MKYNTREEWLQAAITTVRPLFDEIGADPFPAVRVSCGWPKGGRKAIGQCWPSTLSGDDSVEMFISPELSDPIQVLGTLVHELIHAVDNCENGHRGPFRVMAKTLGLEGKMTATVLGEEIEERLRLSLGNLGPYPHVALSNPAPKQSTRMVKLDCPECGYVIRTTRKWIEVGLPDCPCGREFQVCS